MCHNPHQSQAQSPNQTQRGLPPLLAKRNRWVALTSWPLQAWIRRILHVFWKPSGFQQDDCAWSQTRGTFRLWSLRLLMPAPPWPHPCLCPRFPRLMNPQWTPLFWVLMVVWRPSLVLLRLCMRWGMSCRLRILALAWSCVHRLYRLNRMQSCRCQQYPWAPFLAQFLPWLS